MNESECEEKDTGTSRNDVGGGDGGGGRRWRFSFRSGARHGGGEVEPTMTKRIGSAPIRNDVGASESGKSEGLGNSNRRREMRGFCFIV